MKVHTNLEELLEDFAFEYRVSLENDSIHTFNEEFIKKYLSSNSLASVEPEPLAKNKDSVSCRKCKNRTFIIRHSDWLQCTECNKIKILSAT